MAIDPNVASARRRLWELAAHGMERVPLTTRRLAGKTYPKTGGFFFFGSADERHASPLAVRAVAEVLEELVEPGWLLTIEEARLIADSPRVVAARCELPIEAVLAALGNWRTRL